MGKYEFLLWDVDETLLDFKKSQAHALTFAFEQFDRKCSAEILDRYDAINDSYWKRFEKGEIAKQEIFCGRFERLFAEWDINDILIPIFQKIYQKALGEVYYYRDDSYRLLEELSRSCRMFLVTNGVNTTQMTKLRLSGLDTLVENIFVSEEIGMPKPNKEYFDRCFSQISDFCKEKAIIIGDSLSSDMKGGYLAGITTCWYNPEQKINNTGIPIDYEIKNLWDVKGIL